MGGIVTQAGRGDGKRPGKEYKKKGKSNANTLVKIDPYFYLFTSCGVGWVDRELHVMRFSTPLGKRSAFGSKFGWRETYQILSLHHHW